MNRELLKALATMKHPPHPKREPDQDCPVCAAREALWGPKPKAADSVGKDGS